MNNSLLFCVAGISQGFCETASFAVLTDQFPVDLVSVIALNELVIGIVFIIGPPFGAALYVAAGFAFPFLVIAGCSGLVLLVFMVFELGIVWSSTEERESDAEDGRKEEEQGEVFQLSSLWHLKIITPSITVPTNRQLKLIST